MKYIKHSLLTLLLSIFSLPTFAGPWIEVGDTWLRSDIEYLSDTGVITVPITTWPLMWSGIKRDLDSAMESAEFNKLSNQQQDALIRLKKEFRKQTSSSASVGVSLASDPELIRGFSNSPREESSAFVQNQAMGDVWAYNVKLEYAYNPYIAAGQTSDEVRYDGSYITTIFDNFALGYGWIDKWWGPGWDSSLILTNNARPSPGLFFTRNYSTPFESDWLSWIGPWTFQAFANVLDDERHINDAKFLGLSLSFKPLDSLEIGLRRTAQWGGDGRPESLSSFIDMFFGRDNCGSGGIDACGSSDSNEPGNQLAAVDIRWRLPIDYPVSLYTQMMGEDESNYQPSRTSHQYGISFHQAVFDYPMQLTVEYSDTRTHSSSLGLVYNLAYNHTIYRTGYRYLGRTIGASTDNDTEIVTIAANVRLDTQQSLNILFRDIRMNLDGLREHSISLQKKELTEFVVNYQRQMKLGELKVHLGQYSDIIDSYNRQDSETRLGATFKTIF